MHLQGASMKSVLLLSVFISSFNAVFTRIELGDFYPYGPENGDTLIPSNDDGSSGLVNIAVSFPFFDRNHRSLYVNTNGAISFLRQVSQYTPDPFPLGDQRRVIAPFWADVDTRRGGFVYYRETQDLRIRTRVSQEIRKYFVRQRTFLAKWTMIVTWLNVARYRGSLNISVVPPFNSINNTFQTILATDGLYSFSIFHYNKIEWTFGTLSIGVPAQAGFNAGDGYRYFNIPNSRTPAIINITSTSNYEVPGLWIFQVDGMTVENHGCTSNGGTLVLSPRSGIVLGGTKVYIGGPCYTPQSRIVCRFKKTTKTSGSYISPERAYCITPRLYVVGLISVELSLDGGATFNFKGTFRSVPLGRNIAEVQGLEVEHWANSTSAVLTWDQDAVNSSHVDVEIFLFESFRFRLRDASFATFKNVSNTGSYSLSLSKERISSITKKRRRKRDNDESPIAIVSIHETATSSPGLLNNAVARFFSDVYLISWLVNIEQCDLWYNLQPNANEIAKLQEELPPCPPSLQAIRVDDAFVADTGIKLLLSSFYHPGSKLCFRSRFASSSGAGQQCCYDDSDRLMVGPPGGGSLDIVSPEESFWSHMGRDVLPWYACCLLSDKCNKYYHKRPSDDGSRYWSSPTASINGDPHLATFDGTLYTFNGYGEYVLLQIKEDINLMFQGRMIPLINEQGEKTNATALTAFVVRELGSDIVQIEFNTRRLVDVSINGELVNFDEQSRLDFNGVFVVKQNQSEVGIYFHSGVSILTRAIEGFLAYEASIPPKYKEKTAGLLGFWDDNKQREFLLPNGSFIHTNSSSRTLHHEFGQKWLVESSNSLFTYRIGESYNSFLDLHFAPIFMDEIGSLFSNTTLEEEAKNVCGENKECLFDISMTGKTSIGQATLNSIKKLQKRTNDSKIVLKPIYFGCDGVENSGKRMDACGVCDGDNSTCTDCEGNVKPGLVKNERACDFHPWSAWSNCSKSCGQGMRTRICLVEDGKCSIYKQEEKCKISECDEDDTNPDFFTKYKYYIYAGGAALVLFVLLVFAFCLCVRRPKRSSSSPVKPRSVTHINRAFIAEVGT